tara:strand:- start:65 stop:400 length:336 start_codon:yes stop_codon:yes gene_type:complete
MADIEPKEKPGLGTLKIISACKNRLGQAEFFSIEAAVFINMRIIAPRQRGGGLRRQRALRAGDLTQTGKRAHGPYATGNKAASQPRQIGALRQGVESQYRRTGEIFILHDL